MTARDRKECVVNGWASGSDRDIVACRMHTIREHDDDRLGVGIDPQTRPGETKVPERPGTGARPRARAGLALAIEASAKRAPRPRTDEPFGALPLPPWKRERPLPSSNRVVDGAAKREHCGLRPEHSRMSRSAFAGECPCVLVVHAASDLTTSPRHDLGRSNAPREIDTSARKRSRRAELILAAESLYDEVLDDLSCVACALRPRESLTDQDVAEIAVKRSEPLLRCGSDRVLPTSIGHPSERGDAVDALSGDEGLVH